MRNGENASHDSSSHTFDFAQMRERDSAGDSIHSNARGRDNAGDSNSLACGREKSSGRSKFPRMCEKAIALEIQIRSNVGACDCERWFEFAQMREGEIDRVIRFHSNVGRGDCAGDLNSLGCGRVKLREMIQVRLNAVEIDHTRD